MAKGLPTSLRLHDYGVAAADVVRTIVHCEPGQIRRKVVVSPIWGDEVFRGRVQRMDVLVEGSAWEMRYRDEALTLLCPGIGAARVGDVVAALGCTPCESLILTGSAGGLDAAMRIGDLLLPEKMLCGEGFSRYLAAVAEPPDCFFARVPPAPALSRRIAAAARAHCGDGERDDLTLHRGAVASVDSIVLQFPHLEWMAARHGCIGVEMEGSAVCAAAAMVGIEASALFVVSDVWPLKKSFMSNTDAREKSRRRDTRDRVAARIVLDALTDALTDAAGER